LMLPASPCNALLLRVKLAGGAGRHQRQPAPGEPALRRPNGWSGAGDDRRMFFGPQPPDRQPRRDSWLQLARPAAAAAPAPAAQAPTTLDLSDPAAPPGCSLAGGSPLGALSSRAPGDRPPRPVAPGSAPTGRLGSSPSVACAVRAGLSSRPLSGLGLHAPPLLCPRPPAYVLASRSVRKLAAGSRVPLRRVQHHHAHFAWQWRAEPVSSHRCGGWPGMALHGATAASGAGECLRLERPHRVNRPASSAWRSAAVSVARRHTALL